MGAGDRGQSAAKDGLSAVGGAATDLKLEQIHFSGWLIGEDVPLPITGEELAHLVTAAGRIPVGELLQKAVETYGAERATEQAFLTAVQNCVKEGQFGYAAAEGDPVQTGLQMISLGGYIGKPDVLPPGVRVVRISGTVASPTELATVIKTTMGLSQLGASRITLDLRLELVGDVNEHSVTMALNELRGRTLELKVEEQKGA